MSKKNAYKNHSNHDFDFIRPYRARSQIEVAEDLEKKGLKILFKKHEVKTAKKPSFKMSLPVICQKDGRPLFIMTKLDFAVMAQFINHWQIDRKWLEKNASLPVFDLNPQLLTEFENMFKRHFQPEKEKSSPSLFSNRPSQSREEINKDSAKKTVPHTLSEKITLFTIPQFAQEANFRICVGGGLKPGSQEMIMGKEIYQAIFENIGVYILRNKTQNNFAYLFYREKKLRERLKKALDLLAPGKKVLLKTSPGQSYIPEVSFLEIDGKVIIEN